MHVLLVAATYFEIAPLISSLQFVAEIHPRLKTYRSGQLQVDLLLTGVGITATGVWTARTLAATHYDLAINAGVCGSFGDMPGMGEVVNVTSDFFPELGAEDGEEFLTVHELSLLGENEAPFQRSRLFASAAEWPQFKSLPQVNGITVNKVHGNAASIEAVRTRWNPHTESMEGAAFFYACLTAAQPCVQIRAVSNKVERRNREAWNMALAIRHLNDTLTQLLQSLQ
ncbi:MAG: futalosine hydrolase [Bacteroidia bacterium]|nr:futalosine hydrolase [Bacteroidia bacterium]